LTVRKQTSLLMVTMRPRPAAFIAGRQAWISRYGRLDEVVERGLEDGPGLLLERHLRVGAAGVGDQDLHRAQGLLDAAMQRGDRIRIAHVAFQQHRLAAERPGSRPASARRARGCGRS
jgi:hypothetical protein